MVDDARYWVKYYLESYDTPANITKNDGSTLASYIYQFERPPYPLKRVFFSPKNVDGVYTIYTPVSEPHLDWKGDAYAYTEVVPIGVDTTTKQGIAGDKLRWKMELELRRIVEEHAFGNVWNLTRMAPAVKDMGAWKMDSVLYSLRYKREVDDYTSLVAISYGVGFTYDCDRLSGGPEGTWTLDLGAGPGHGTQSVTEAPGFLKIDLTTDFHNDIWTVNDGSINVAVDSHSHVRFRYKTTGNAKAKIVLENTVTATETVLLETASTDTFTVTDVELETLTGTIKYMYLYACDGVGAVYYDFVQIYAGDFDFPNVTDIPFEPTSHNVQLGIPGRVPSITQNLGAEPARIELLCDLNVETDTYSWKRVGDVDLGDVFLDILHNQSVNAPWQWLVWGNKQCKVTLDDVLFSPRDNTVRVMGHEYSDSNKISEYYYQRWSLDT